MRIAHLTPTFSGFSGIDRVVHSLAAEQKDKGNSVTIFALEADMKPPENTGFEIMGMPENATWQRIYRLIMPLDIYKALRWVPKLKHFDIIYSHYYPMNWLAYLAKRFCGVKFIYYNYGINYPELFPCFLERTYLRVFIALANWTIRRANGAISISQFLQQELEKETGLISEVAYPKIDTSQFHLELDSLRVRNKYDLGSSPLLVYTGRISPHKGVHLLIDAFNLVRQEIPDAKLLIVGKHTFPAYSKKLREMADSSVIFAGYVADEELPYYYAACDVYATATMWEGFNLPLAEAQACGRPVVAFNIGPHPEVIKDGETGFLVSPRDSGALAKAIVNLLKDDNLRQEISKNARKLVRKRFT